MKSWRTWVAGLVAVVLSACGGGGGGGTPIVGPTPSPTAANLVLVLSEATISNSGTTTVDATVTAVDSNNNALPNIPVTIKVDANATVTVTETRTGADGRLIGKIGIGADRTVRTITVTAESTGLSKTATLRVIEGGTGGTPTAADLIITLSAAQLANSGTQTVTATATAVDANRNAVASIPVTISVDAGAIIKVSGATTNSDGQVTGAISIGEDKSNRVVTVTATSGTLTRTTSLQITGSQIRSTLLPGVLSVGQTGKVQYRLLDTSGNPVAGKRITVLGPNGVQTIATSDLNGDYEYVYISPSVAGEVQIRASALGVESVSTVIVQAVEGLPDVTDTVVGASVSANPSVVAVNTATTKNQASIRALFVGPGNKPLKNIRVRFDLDGDRQFIGGTLTAGSTLVYTDDSGVASTSYLPGSRFSPTDGVTVRACWDRKNFAAGTCPNAVRTTLTVIQDSLSVSIGTNFEILEDVTRLKYVVRFAVQVSDSSGLAAPDVQVSASIDLLQYVKGFYILGLNDQGRQIWVQRPQATCDNEDLNRNGVSEIYTNGVVEDANNSFNLTNGRPALEPRKADVVIAFEGSSRTSTGGVAVVRIEYPKNIASWVRYNLVVGASGVGGSEGRANFVGGLPVPAEPINNFSAAPPFVDSPYGLQSSPTIEVNEPNSTKQPAVLCTNPN